MILGFKPQDDIYIFRTKDGNRFEMKIRYIIHIFVPSRDGTETMHRTIFDLKTLLFKHKVAFGTTADEAFAAIKYLRTLPPTDEFDGCIAILQQFLNDNRRDRKQDYLIRMVELYGREIGATLFTAIGKREFRFPAFHLREEATAKFVKNVLDNYPGVASSTKHIDRFESLVAMCHRCGGSKFSSMVRKTVDENPCMKFRIDSALQAAKYIEQCHQFIGSVPRQQPKCDSLVKVQF